MSEGAKWYVVHTYSGYEKKVADTIQKTVKNRNLQELIFDIRIPMETVTEVSDTGTREVERKLFPGYVLVKMHMNDESWYIIRNTRGVTSFVGPESKPVPLTEKEIAALGVETIEVKLSYAVGDSVKVIDGPFDGSIGTVTEISLPKGTVMVNVSMFGRETPVELSFNQVASLKK
ncbi:MAG: transcription termination/antitermination factor NusG [Clostridia bacterium]|nr:transcription termination/antitermination factor NusG [Clostridia bacterium]MBR4875992.1 transcription termination/antitermination factor NusG [Clostridia bacterium]MBR5284407.1 transcription termination/antitermination factor NusG [Clostridia bacterium]